MSRRVALLAVCTLVSLVGPSLSPGAENVPDTATRINALIHDDDVAQLLAYIRTENIELNAPYWQGITLLSQAANEDRPHNNRLYAQSWLRLEVGLASGSSPSLYI